MGTEAGTTERPASRTAEILAGQRALITGGSQGIGRAIAETFVAHGASVILAALPGPELSTAAAELSSRCGVGQTVDTVGLDLAQRDAVRAMFADIRSSGSGLNILVANAGTGSLGAFVDVPDEEWDRILAVNLTATFTCCQEAARIMLEMDAQSNRAMVLISSIRGEMVRPDRVPYAVSKAGVNQLARAAAFELAPSGIRVNVIAPGITRTSLALGNPENFEQATRSVPLGRAGEPVDMASAALYLCSPAARFVTGARLPVDGGESLW